MKRAHIQLRPGTLWPALVNRSRHALGCGAMQPIATEQAFVDDQGIRFLVRKVSSLERKDEQRKRLEANQGEPHNPFLPYEQDLFVAHISARHVAVLNKFNVIDHHLLIVTRQFEHQETLLSAEDFAALAACLREFEGLGFYNGGLIAGASQPHKHLQLVPLPLAEGPPGVPMEPAFDASRGTTSAGTISAFGFRNAFEYIVPEMFDDPLLAGVELRALYLEMLERVGLHGVPAAGTLCQSAPYNLLLTRHWMLLVPRSRERFESISVNALGFAGSLFVRNDAQLERVKQVGPMAVLREVAFPAPA